MAPSLFRKRHEAEDIIPIPGPLEAAAISASGRDRLENLQQFEKSHKFDPNLPIDDLTDVDAAIATGNAEKGIEIEHALMEDNSPYPEVRAVVRNYDVDVPANTIRAWVIGMVLCTIGSGINMLFSLRNPSITVSTYVVQLVAYPLGLGWDLIMPDREWNLFGLKFNLKPGKFNYKEHVVIVAMSNAAYGGGVLYATDVLLAQQIFYGQKFGWAFQVLFGITTLCTGYGLAGLARRFLVWPAAMIWPTDLVNCALFYTLHDHSGSDPTKTNGWKVGRYRWFLIVAGGGFIWYWFPGWIFKGLSYFTWICWVAPHNVTVNKIFGGLTGYGLMPTSFDWTVYSGYLQSPLIPPFHAIANVLVGIVVFFVCISMGIHFTGTWYSDYFPVQSSESYDNTGNVYNVSRILDHNFHFNETAYKEYSPLFLPTQFALSYGLSFAAVTAVVVHVFLYHGQEIWRQFRQARNQEDDVHMRLMKALHDAHPSVDAAVTNLRQLVQLQGSRSTNNGPRFPRQLPLPPGGLCKLPMPPIEAVVPLLKALNSGTASFFAFGMTLVGIEDFSSLCRMIYFPTEDFPQAIFAIVNAGLYDLFMEECCLSDDVEKRDKYEAYAMMARANLETYLANLPMFLSARIENVQALLLGTQYAIDVTRPSVAWHLNSIAAQLCQTGGFHRADVASTESARTKQIKGILFWQVYSWDRGLSLRMGRASVINDGDITIPRQFDFSGFPLLEKPTTPKFWLERATLQGQIYIQLYSPAALAVHPSELGRRAEELAVECRRLAVEGKKAQQEAFAYLKQINSSELVDVFVQGDEVQFLATMTLVYRAIPAPPGSPSRFSNECLETARQTMRRHKETVALLKKYGAYMKSIYVHRNLMLAPFAPFFVLFCHIVETLSGDDLGMLQEFVASLDVLRDASETAEKLCRIFQVFRDVAMVYVEAKSQRRDDQNDVPMGNQLDAYLSQLGFMPMEGQSMPQAVPPTTGDVLMPPGVGSGPTTQMEAWFLGSRSMFGLLEEDLGQIDPMGWMPPPSSGTM